MVAVLSGAEGDRTPDLSVANAALSQLSYGPIFGRLPSLARGRESFAKIDQIFDHPNGRDRIRTCDLYDVNVAL